MAFSSTSTLLLGMLMRLVLGAPPTCPPGVLEMTWHGDPDKCSAFHMCHMGRLYSFDCGADTVWSEAVMTCVGRNSRFDKCTKGSGETCIYAKMDNCAQYYDCKSTNGMVSSDPRVQECPFPQLFDTQTSQCLYYDSVTCGSTPEPKDPCDYVAEQCQGRSHCIPCNIRYPTCNGQPDGLNPWVGKENSPLYVYCENGRAVYTGECNGYDGPQIFDPIKRKCVGISE